VTPDGHDNKWHGNLVAIKSSDINTIQVPQKPDTRCGPSLRADHAAQGQGADIPLPGLSPGELGGGTHRAAAFQQCEERMETQRLQLPISTTLIPGKSWSAC